MAKREITNCGDCAYVHKESNGMWCPFHDEPVSNKVVCDYFLDYFDSPQMASLLNGESKENCTKKIPQYTGKDIFALILTGLCIATGTAVTLYFGLFII